MAVGREWWEAIVAGPDGRLDSDSGSGEDRYLVLPSAEDARVLVDVDCAVALRDAGRRFAAARNWPKLVGHVVAAAAPAARRIGGVWQAWPADATIRTYLSAALGRDLRLSLAIGPDRPNRKPIVRCYDESGLVALVKLGPAAHTGALVRNEGDWLERFDATPAPGVRSGRVLHRGRFGSSEVLAMSVLEVPDGAVPVAEMPDSVLRNLVERHGTSVGIDSGGYLTELTARLDGLADRVVSTALSATHADERGDEVVGSLWHGDWSPWNVGRADDGSVSVWDWERTRLGVPVGFDSLHLHYQYGKGMEAGVAAAVRLGVDPGRTQLLAMLYLLELAARQYEAGELDSERYARIRVDLEAWTVRRSAGVPGSEVS